MWFIQATGQHHRNGPSPAQSTNIMMRNYLLELARSFFGMALVAFKSTSSGLKSHRLIALWTLAAAMLSSLILVQKFLHEDVEL